MELKEVLERYEPVIGLEIHAQLNTKSKAYSNDINEFGAIPNTNISPTSLGHPGTLPVFNENTLKYAVRLGLACHSNITRDMHFDRKNYFYADLPKGYQITQDKTPICRGGAIMIKGDDGNEKAIELTRIHMEEDSGKSTHDMDPFDTLIDLNRAGVPLVEIVTEPVIKSANEAYNYLTEVRKLLRYLEICDGNMEEGSMRCDVNISIMPRGSKQFGQRVEVKNMNSMRNVAKAIEFEIVRHAELIEKGEPIVQETRNYDATSNSTVGMRKKEDAHDYRYFPEPDLTPLHVTQAYIDQQKEALPPLPNDLFKKYQKELGLSEYDATNLTENKGIALYFEDLIQKTSNYKSAANWMMGSIKSYLNQNALTIASFPISVDKIAALINIIDEGKISNSVASQKVFPKLLETPNISPLTIAKENNWITQSDSNTLEDIVLTIFKENPAETERFKNGEKKLTGFFMGKIMKATKGAADPKTTNQILNQVIQKL
ncbi:MAG: Asp-tRNA(Asn)/Glu-tRNA(Gln) amidotransferase subunit GatB [Flavobacteriales bacterium]|jgi:aspartyl-tRNA(Asn)/glutamyl-tRNA(Gln) amidotransferase subunit B|nr:Asp-tRNA(Asn)/Glu-tRNA(Gln) amidotransferase subunit GatB [Flavobacteriales bacterium]